MEGGLELSVPLLKALLLPMAMAKSVVIFPIGTSVSVTVSILVGVEAQAVLQFVAFFLCEGILKLLQALLGL